MYFPTKELLPLFSQSKINECHSDITFPTYYGIDSLLSEEQQKQLIPWEERQNTLFFRGSTTGKASQVMLSASSYCQHITAEFLYR